MGSDAARLDQALARYGHPATFHLALRKVDAENPHPLTTNRPRQSLQQQITVYQVMHSRSMWLSVMDVS